MSQPVEPQLVGFGGHETFPLRYGWLKKAVDATGGAQHQALAQPEAFVELGVGKNMVHAIRYWSLATGILQPYAAGTRNTGVEPSELGKMLLQDGGFDPYLEDPGTLWLIHWQLAGRPGGPVTWYWAFNCIREPEFTREKLVLSLQAYVEAQDLKRVAASSVKRDIDCLIRSYVPVRASKSLVFEETLDSPLTDLHLIREIEEGRLYAFGRGEHPTLPTAIVAYAVAGFWQLVAPDSLTLTFDQVAYSPRSPGQVFKLSEDALATYLETMEDVTGGMISFRTTAGLRQLHCRSKARDVHAIDVLARYYETIASGYKA